MTKKSKFLLFVITAVFLYLFFFLPTCRTNNLHSLINNLGARDMEVVECCMDKLFQQYEQAGLANRTLILEGLVAFLLQPERTPALVQQIQYVDDMDDYYNKQSELYSKTLDFIRSTVSNNREERLVVIQQLKQANLSLAQQLLLKQLQAL